MAFIPITRQDAFQRGWTEFDVIFVSGDAYVDHPAFGVPLLARLLESHGFRVGIIPQPDWKSLEPFMALGRPALFFAVSAGAMDSMVAHYTPARKLRHDDAYTPGNRHGGRPNRATIVYTSRLKEAFRDVPVVIGGIEASLRRFAHYDYWEDRVRRSILFDSKADLLVYGMGERPLLEIADRMRRGETIKELCNIHGTAVAVGPGKYEGLLVGARELPSFEEVSSDKKVFAEAFRLAEKEMNPYCGAVVGQRHGTRYLICNPPSMPLSEAEMDKLYALPFQKAPHPSYKEPIPAFEQIRTSITTHRGCLGGCSFCAISIHQGKIIQSRSAASIADEIRRLTTFGWFSGNVSDVGGPTANMYGARCNSREALAKCRRVSCLYPKVCSLLHLPDRKSARLLKMLRGIAGIRSIAVASGIRHDLLPYQKEYFRELLAYHVGGLLKVAPEHLTDSVTGIMRKPGCEVFNAFFNYFRTESERLGRRQFLVPYLMSGHPGCTLADMVATALVLKRLGLRVEQVQDFTPTPGTLATCMYHTGLDPYSGQEIYVARTDRDKRLQKSLLLYHLPEQRKTLLDALRAAGKESVLADLVGGLRKNRTDHPSINRRSNRKGPLMPR